MPARGNVGVSPARWCGLLVAVVACWQIRGVAEYDFVELDDVINIVVNPHLGPPSGPTLSWLATDLEYMRRYLPLGWLGFSLVYGFSGLAPAGYHAANAGLHVANSVLGFGLVLLLLRRLAPGVDERWRCGCATLAALAWSLHPLRAETIGWASGLLYGMSGFVALLSVLAYLRAGAPGASRGRWVALAGILYFASMLAYPMSLGLLGVFVLLDLAPAGLREAAEGRRLWREKLWLLAPFAVVLALTVTASQRASAFWGPVPTWAEFGLGARVLQAAAAWAYYLWKPWWPAGLTPVPTWLVDPAAIRVWAFGGLAVVGLVSIALLAGGRRWRGVTLLWWAHAGLLAPLLGWTEKPYFAADRYHYLAGWVLAVAVALALVRVGGRRRIWAMVAGAVVVVALGVAQRDQLRIWTSTDTVMARIVERADHPAVRADYEQRWLRYHANRGDALRTAAVAKRLGITLEPGFGSTPGGVPLAAAVHLRLALYFRGQERRMEAHEHFWAALQLAPDWGEAAFNWALLHASDGAASEALHWYRRAAASGRGNPVPTRARQQLLALIGELFFMQHRALLAVRTVETALREGGAGGGAADLGPALREQLARYRAALGR